MTGRHDTDPHDTVFIRGLTIHAHHGVMDHEAKVGQRFEIDIDLDIDLADAARSDKLADTVSYAAVAETATRAFTGGSYKLIERAAGLVCDAILAEFPQVRALRVTVHKPHAPIAAIFGDAGVTLSRRRGGKG